MEDQPECDPRRCHRDLCPIRLLKPGKMPLDRASCSCMRGMTLVEALVTIAIIGILGSLALPSFDGLRDKYRLKAAAEAFYGDLQYARSVAIRSNSTVHISLISSCWGMNTSSACTCSTASSCLVKVANIADFPGVTMTPSIDTTSLDGTRGLARGGAATMTFTSTLGKQAQVSLSALGRASLCSPNTTAAAYVSEYPAC